MNLSRNNILIHNIHNALIVVPIVLGVVNRSYLGSFSTFWACKLTTKSELFVDSLGCSVSCLTCRSGSRTASWGDAAKWGCVLLISHHNAPGTPFISHVQSSDISIIHHHLSWSAPIIRWIVVLFLPALPYCLLFCFTIDGVTWLWARTMIGPGTMIA